MAERDSEDNAFAEYEAPSTSFDLLAPESEERAGSLRRALRRSKGFSLHVVIADGTARREITRRLRAWSGTGGVPRLHFFDEGESGARALERWVAEAWGKEASTGVVLSDGDALIADGSALSALNVARDRLGQLIKGPFVVVLSPRSEAEMATIAPDLFDVRAGTWEFETAPASARVLRRSIRSIRNENWPKVPKADLQIAAASLRALKSEQDPPPPGGLANAWLKVGWSFLNLRELGESLAAAEEAEHYAKSAGYTAGIGEALSLKARGMMESGRYKEAEDFLHEALNSYRELGDRRMQAAVLHNLGHVLRNEGRIEDALATVKTELQLCQDIQDEEACASAYGGMAHLLVAQENLDEALRVYREECLPVYEKLGDSRNVARVSAEIADILAERGQLDEALRLCRDVALPVFERLGDAHASAATWSKISDYLQLSGDLDEALQILVQKSLPVFTALGYSRERAINWSRIADIASIRGNFDEAIRITVEEVLPVYEEIIEPRDLFLAQINLVRLYTTRNRPGDWDRATELFRQALEAAEKSHVPELRYIKELQLQISLNDKEDDKQPSGE